MDIADTAQEAEFRTWEANNQRQQQPTTFAPDDSGYGPAECEECGATMHPVRRSYGFKHCIDCATLAERLRVQRR